MTHRKKEQAARTAPVPLTYEHIVENLSNAIDAKQLQQIALVGATPKVGTSTVARQLAETLALANRNVLLITVHADAENETAPVDVHAALGLGQPAQKGLTLKEITSHNLPYPASDEEEDFAQVMQQLAQQYNVILWDLPPTGQAVQSRMVGHYTQGVVLVVEAGKSRWQSANYAVEHLRLSGCKILGVILNKKKAYIPNCLYKLFFRYV